MDTEENRKYMIWSKRLVVGYRLNVRQGNVQFIESLRMIHLELWLLS
jgi:hypothetical protein